MSAEAVAAVETPELDRRSRVALTPDRKAAEVLTEFYDWLAGHGLVLAKWGEQRQRLVHCPDCPLIVGVKHPIRQRERDVLGIDAHGARRYTGLTVGDARDYEAGLRARRPCPTCDGRGYVDEEYIVEDVLTAHHEAPERLFARFFGLDLDKIDDEQRALLEALRE